MFPLKSSIVPSLVLFYVRILILNSEWSLVLAAAPGGHPKSLFNSYNNPNSHVPSGSSDYSANKSSGIYSSSEDGRNSNGNFSGEYAVDRFCSDKPGGCRRPTGIDMKNLSLQMIKHDILRKLRMDENRLPNVTGKGFTIPPDYLNEFIYMPNDSPRDDYDDEHATTEKIIAFSRIRKFQFLKTTEPILFFTFLCLIHGTSFSRLTS